MKEAPITAEFLWINHRAALGGKSAISGAPLPEYLHDCNAGVQGSHWGMAAAVSRALGYPEPPLPAKVTLEDAARIRHSLEIKQTG